jgi:thiosulfate reductase cytochrome b subunit
MSEAPTSESPLSEATSGASPPAGRTFVYRHSVLVRITHWINVLCILVLVMSGLQIFNAHPSLYWGERSHFDDPVLSMRAENSPEGPVGVTTVLGASFETTGVLGLSRTSDGRLAARGFPSWATLPSYQDLATGRRWHFFFAWLFVVNGIVYVVASFLNRHVWRDLIPSRAQLRGIGTSIKEHLRLRFDHGRDYNVLQKLTYLILIFVILPLVVLAGLGMSPGVDAAFPWIVDLFAGRQSARTLHFIAATAIVLFVVIHVVMVLISGVWNNLRSMITGRYAIGEKSHD